MSGSETFFAIRLTDGDLIYGDYAWMTADGPDDWTVAEDADHDRAVEYEIVEMTVRPVARKTFGLLRCDVCDEPSAELDDDGRCSACVSRSSDA